MRVSSQACLSGPHLCISPPTCPLNDWTVLFHIPSLQRGDRMSLRFDSSSRSNGLSRDQIYFNIYWLLLCQWDIWLTCKNITWQRHCPRKRQWEDWPCNKFSIPGTHHTVFYGGEGKWVDACAQLHVLQYSTQCLLFRGRCLEKWPSKH